MIDLSYFDTLKLSLASPEEIKSWSFGEVTKPETVNYRTLRPEKDGLFCERIFGPTRDYECYCGKYKKIRYRGVICDKCGVEVTTSKVRRERMGHINLAVPVVHTWFFRRSPSKLSLLLNISPRDLEAVIYFAEYLVEEVDAKEKKKVLEKMGERLEQKKQTFMEESEAKVKELKVQLEQKIKVLIKEQEKEKGARKEGLEIKIENLKLKHQEDLVYLKEEVGEKLQQLEESYQRTVEIVTQIKPLRLLPEGEFSMLDFWEADSFMTVGMGAESLLKVLESLDLKRLVAELKKQGRSRSKSKRVKANKQLKLVQGLIEGRIDPNWMILRVLPVIPPDLRPMVQLPGGRFATSDLNDLYRKVINRNNRLKGLIRLGAPSIILQNEKRMLQEAVDALIEGPRRPVRRRQKELRSLSEMLKGKQGRFRQNLLGKRVDYSGRSVIVVGPELRLDKIGLPKEMALELFRPFVLRELIMEGYAPNLKSAKNVLEERGDEVWDILERVTKDHPVLLNRAPTLHRQNIQAFYPVLIEGDAIRLHPAVCAGYNADFDGDQMAVHVPLSQRAIQEAREKMLSPLNLLKLADGQPVVDMKNELSLGLYFLTTINPEARGAGKVYFDREQAISAHQNGVLDLQAPIITFWGNEKLETSVGRILLNEVLPLKLRFYNQPVDRGNMRNLITVCFNEYGIEETVNLIDALKDFGRKYATLFGISFSAFDFEVPEGREQILREAGETLTRIESNYRRGLTTERERHSQVITLWEEVTNKVAELALGKLDPLSVVGMIINSKASRANRDTLRQIEAMRGLMVDSQGQIKETPIRTSAIEGSTSFEGFLSALGGRKGLIDTALLTAVAGYLTRRLVDVAHDILIREHDCGTKAGVSIRKEEELEDWTMKERIMGRVASEDIVVKGEVIVKSSEIITEELAARLVDLGVVEVPIRSLFTCRTRYGVCQLCYGQSTATRRLVDIGEAAGVIAAQSIGEPGTQLTLRTFHAAGIATKEITQGLPRVEELFENRTPKEAAVVSELSGVVHISEKDKEKVVAVVASEEIPEVYVLKKEDVVAVKDGSRVKTSELLFTSLSEGEILAPSDGRVKMENNKLVLVGQVEERREYRVPTTAELKVKNGDVVMAGDALTAGSLDVDEILKLRGIEIAQKYLLGEIQSVYRSQGVTILDKHLEVIVRKMSEKVRIDFPGDTDFLVREYVDWARFREENSRVHKEGGRPATGQRIILGITRASLLTESWLSAASFQDTTNVLAMVAVGGRPQVDHLLGLKENVIIGRLVPTGERVEIKE